MKKFPIVLQNLLTCLTTLCVYLLPLSPSPLVFLLCSPFFFIRCSFLFYAPPPFYADLLCIWGIRVLACFGGFYAKLLSPKPMVSMLIYYVYGASEYLHGLVVSMPSYCLLNLRPQWWKTGNWSCNFAVSWITGHELGYPLINFIRLNHAHY